MASVHGQPTVARYAGMALDSRNERRARGRTRNVSDMSETVDNLILDLLEWIGPGQRPYNETLEAWRTSCPRLPVWEDATDRGFIERHREPGRPAVVYVSAAGAEHLRTRRTTPHRG